MRLSTRARYAIRMMFEIAKQPDGEAVSLGEVAENIDISRRYLDQLATVMKNMGLLRGRAGRGGGYALARPASEILISQIVEAGIGPINIVDCVLEPDTCQKANVCECRAMYAVLNRRITQVFETLSLADLADQDNLRVLAQEFGGHEDRVTHHLRVE